jgi:predicted permease
VKIRSPRFARWLLNVRLHEEWRDFVVGDLEEEFAARSCDSRLAARAWFWWQTIRCLASPPPVRRAPKSHSSSRGDSSIRAVLYNLRYAARTLRNAPGFSATIVATLALGIGANSAVFSGLDAVLLRSLPFRDADRIVSVSQVLEGPGVSNLSPARLEDWNRLASTFEAISGYTTNDVVDTTGDLPERLRQGIVAPRFLDVLGISPAPGRGFTAEEHRFGGPTVVLLSDGLWRRRGAPPDVAGSTIQSAGRAVTVAGVMPNFPFPLRDVDVWGAFPADAPFAQARGMVWLAGIGRLKPGVTIEQARADLERVQAQLAMQYPDTDRNIGVELEPFANAIVAGARGPLWLLFAAVSVLLLIVCTNVAALLFARAAQREQEIAVRASLGASRLAIAGQALTEMAVLAGAGGALGLLVAAAASRAFQMLVPELPRVEQIGIDARIVAYTMASTAAVTLLCGLLPAIRSTRVSSGLVRAGRTHVSERQSLQWLLVGVQVTFAVTLLAGSGLLLRSFDALSRVDKGFEPEGVLAFHVTARFGDEDFARIAVRIERTLEGLGSVPGVESAATSMLLPGIPGERQEEFALAGGRAETEPKLIAESRVVSAAYFSTLQIPLVAGQLCRQSSQGGPIDAMVNSRFAESYFAGRSPIGQQLAAKPLPLRIVGIVGDARDGCSSAPDPSPWYLVRTRLEPEIAELAVRAKLNELEPLRPVHDLAPLAHMIGDVYAQERLQTILITFFSVAALALACLGVYGTLSYAASVRRREVGLRVAFGAHTGDIVSHFLTRAIGVVAVASLIGVGLSFLFTRALKSALYGVSVSDPVTLIGVVVVVCTVATIAALLPSLRAARVDPMQALREE